MMSEYVQSLNGVVSLGVVSLIASIAVFAFVLLRAWRLSPASIHILERLPLDPDSQSPVHSDEVNS